MCSAYLQDFFLSDCAARHTHTRLQFADRLPGNPRGHPIVIAEFLEKAMGFRNSQATSHHPHVGVHKGGICQPRRSAADRAGQQVPIPTG